MSKVPQQSAEERLLAALDEVDEGQVVEAIAELDKQIDALTEPLRKKRDRLRKCQMILRGRKMRADGTLGRRKKKGDAVTPETSAPAVALLDATDKKVLVALASGRITAAAIGLEIGEPAHDVLARLNRLETAGAVRRGESGSGTWKLNRPTTSPAR